MEKNDRKKRQLYKLKIPQLRLWQRIVLYISMVLFAVLSILNVILELFSSYIGIVIYILASCTVFPGMYYLVMDFLREVVRPLKAKVGSNQYVSKVNGDYRLKTFVFIVPGVVTNVLYAAFNAVLGIYSRSAWFGSLAAYYILLSVMRIGAVRKEREMPAIADDHVRMNTEIAVYKRNSILFIFLAIVLAGMIISLEVDQGGKSYPGFIIYVAAMFAFYKIIKSTIDVIKVRGKNSPMLSIIRRIGHVDACVSILTLQTAMFASFAEGEELLIKIMNAATGSVVCLLVLFMGIQGIMIANKMGNALEN